MKCAVILRAFNSVPFSSLLPHIFLGDVFHSKVKVYVAEGSDSRVLCVGPAVWKGDKGRRRRMQRELVISFCLGPIFIPVVFVSWLVT